MTSEVGHERLRAIDEAFLHLERVDTPMHVGAVAILERAPFIDAHGRFRLDDVRRLIASRMQLVPKFRQRVVPVPFGRGRPVWVDHDGFTVADHVHLTRLPAPGARRDLFGLAERLMAQLLDRDRPLWEMWFVDGVDDGEHVGLIHRSHHTLTDGVSGVDLAMAVLDFTPEPTVLDDDGWAARAAARPGPARRRLDPPHAVVAARSGARRPPTARRTARRGHRGHPTRAFAVGHGRRHVPRATPVAQLRSRWRSHAAHDPRPARRDPRGRAHLRRHGQRRRARRGEQFAGAPVARARRAARRARGEGVLPGVGARRRAAHGARQPHLRDVRAVAGGGARFTRASPLGGGHHHVAQGTPSGRRHRGDALVVGTGEPHDARPRGACRAPPAARQRDRHQHPRARRAALLPRRADARGVPDRAAVAEPHRERGAALLRRERALRAARRRRVHTRPRAACAAASRTSSTICSLSPKLRRTHAHSLGERRNCAERRTGAPQRRPHRGGHRPPAAAHPQPVRQRRPGRVGRRAALRRPARRLPRRRGRPRDLRAAARAAPASSPASRAPTPTRRRCCSWGTPTWCR